MKEKKDMNRKRAIRARQRKQRNRRIALVLCVMFAVLAVSVGGTMAWLMDKTGSVVNTFTVGDININLTETTGELDEDGNHNYKIIPGTDIEKDPKVTVKAGSEACWLFVKVEGTIPSFLECTMMEGWTELEGQTGVYWRTVEASTRDQVFELIKDNKITVPETVTKDQLKNQGFTLTFTAYAVQQENVATAAAAWNLAKDAT